jgi:hypothetical protein
MGRKDYVLAGEAFFREIMRREEERRRRWRQASHRFPPPHTVNLPPNVICLATYRAARLARKGLDR